MRAFVSLVAVLFVLLAPAAFFNGPDLAMAANCEANDNLTETAMSFIGRCCKGSIQREFPGELLWTTLSAIKIGSSAVHKKAWKLLNDNRFKK